MAIVSGDYVLGVPVTARWGDPPHVMSLYANPRMSPSQVGTALCGDRAASMNFAGVFQFWQRGESVCSKCKAVAPRQDDPGVRP